MNDLRVIAGECLDQWEDDASFTVTAKGLDVDISFQLHYNEELSCGILSVTDLPSEETLKEIEKSGKGNVERTMKRIIRHIKSKAKCGTVIMSNNTTRYNGTRNGKRVQTKNEKGKYLHPALNNLCKGSSSARNPNSQNRIRTWLL